MSKFVIMATWQDAPHLSEKEKADLLSEIPHYQRDARTKGIPQLGSGVIYPMDEEDIVVKDMEIPLWYKKIYGFDVGWNFTAAVWIAINPEDDVAYIYSVYKRSKAEPIIHAAAIKSRGWWIPGAIDPASTGSSQRDGKKLIDDYEGLELNLFYADNAVDAGLQKVWQALSTGKLKVFKSCLPWFEEFRRYARDVKGKIIKRNDHLMDATRYAVMSLDMAEEKPDEDEINVDTQRKVAYAW